MRKAKIVCTIGPASDRLDTLVRLLEQGMSIASPLRIPAAVDSMYRERSLISTDSRCLI